MYESYPPVSILIPFYNCSFVDKAIESALNQEYSNVEVIVINDGSTTHQRLLKPYLNHIKYIEKKNGGVASALNTGISHARGSYISWLSSDDVFHPTKLTEQFYFMKSHNATISATNINLINDKGTVTRKMVGKFYQNPLELLKDFIIQNPINGSTILMSKEVIKKVGLFNQQIRFSQDYEYWARVALQFPIHYLNKALTDYRIHPKMGSIVFHKEQMVEFERLRISFINRIKEKIKSERNY